MHRWLYTWGKTGVAQNKTCRRHAERNAESGKVMKKCGQMIRWKSREVPSNDRLRSTQGYWIQMNTDGYRWIEDPKGRSFLSDLSTSHFSVLTPGTLTESCLRFWWAELPKLCLLVHGFFCSIGFGSVFLSPQGAESMAFLTFYIWYRYDINIYIYQWFFVSYYECQFLKMQAVDSKVKWKETIVKTPWKSINCSAVAKASKKGLRKHQAGPSRKQEMKWQTRFELF